MINSYAINGYMTTFYDVIKKKNSKILILGTNTNLRYRLQF